jgi:hypothetical protein
MKLPEFNLFSDKSSRIFLIFCLVRLCKNKFALALRLPTDFNELQKDFVYRCLRSLDIYILFHYIWLAEVLISTIRAETKAC